MNSTSPSAFVLDFENHRVSVRGIKAAKALTFNGSLSSGARLGSTQQKGGLPQLASMMGKKEPFSFDEFYGSSKARVVKKIGEATMARRNVVSSRSLPSFNMLPEPDERNEEEMSWAARVCDWGPSDAEIAEEAQDLMKRREPAAFAKPGFRRSSSSKHLPSRLTEVTPAKPAKKKNKNEQPMVVTRSNAGGTAKTGMLEAQKLQFDEEFDEPAYPPSEEGSDSGSMSGSRSGSGSGAGAGADGGSSDDGSAEPASPVSPGGARHVLPPRAPSKKAPQVPDRNVRGLSARDARNQSESKMPSNRALLEIAAKAIEGNGLNEERTKKMSTLFARFLAPGKSELHVDDVPELLRFLGHVITDPERLNPVLGEVVHPGFMFLDWDEFCTFMEKYVVFERKEVRRIFDRFDCDRTGEISTEELHTVTKQLGFMPRHAMINEALRVVDEDWNGELNFTEFLKYLAVYSYMEGFTRKEVISLRSSFDMSATTAKSNNPDLNGQRVLAPSALSDALVEVFGLQVSEYAMEMGKRMESGQGLQKSSAKPATGKPESLTFPEFLIFARKVREAQFEKMCLEFPELHRDPDAVVKLPQLERLLGYAPLMAVIQEVLAQVLPAETLRLDLSDVQMDFDEFFDFMLIYRKQDGFSQAQLDDLRDCFVKFDEDESGEVSAIECSAMLIHMGMRIQLDDLRELVREVDLNESGQLDFREFVRLIRLFREQELQGIQKVFNEHKNYDTQKVRVSDIRDVLEELGYQVPESVDLKSPQDEFDFDRIVGICDSCRAILVSKERRKAGWADWEIQYFQDLFSRYDADHGGFIDVTELQTLLKEFEWEPKSKEEQKALMQKIDRARRKSLEADVEDVGRTGEDERLEVRFWPFVQLMRIMKTETDKAEQELLESLKASLRFSEGECEEFRQVFRFWVRKTKEAEADGKDVAEDLNPVVGQKDKLPRDGLRRLIRSLGCSITSHWQDVLDRKFAEMTGDSRQGAVINFPQFLRLMKWLLESDFAGINDKATSRGNPF